MDRGIFLYIQSFFQKTSKSISGHVCQSWKRPIASICDQVATLSSLGLQCFGDVPGQGQGMLCQPPMENYTAMVGEVEEESSCNLPHHSPPVGWCHMVAPTNQALGTTDPSATDHTQNRVVHKLPGPKDASYQMAPDYLDCVRKVLESRQVSADSITSHLAGLKNVTQYDRAFKTFWAFLTEQGSQLPAFPLDEVALQLKKMHFVNQQVAKNAYSAIVAVPGYDSLKFYPLLKECKRQWYSSAKYATFCDCKPVLEKLKDTPVKWTVIRHVRDRLILVLRLIHLIRAVDLA